MSSKVKNSTSMFYKRVEQVYDSSDEAPHSIRRLFGHKCQFVRRPADSGQVMEIMVPILVEKGNRKLAQAEKNSLKYRTPSINQLKRKKQEEQGGELGERGGGEGKREDAGETGAAVPPPSVDTVATGRTASSSSATAP